MTTRPISIPGIKYTALAGFAALAIICALALHYLLHLSWQLSAVDAVVNNLLLAFGCLGLSNMLGYYQPKAQLVTYLSVLAITLTLIITFLAKFILLYFFGAIDFYKDFYNFSIVFRALIVFMCFFWVAIANVLWYRLEEQSETQARLVDAQNLANQAELNKLRHQLQPHFLFNSLNSVFALTMVNPKEAGTMITKLAAFLRGNLKREDQVWVTVAEEMEYIGLYLDIEKVRFSHRLDIQVAIADESLTYILPGTLLQPIIENAIKFGLYNTNKAVAIKINVFIQDGLLRIRVQNPFDPEMKAAKGTGFGLKAIKRRLYLLFGSVDLLQTETEANNIYITTLKIPQLK
ncbi:two-component system LytT family sensor kinase [Pedobacter sp. UYP30]|uniref:sensor histidine kinase n=1 Tax=Pedobacter sp. UYP30 TaxID=1756400 RepID=UPI00339B2528